MILARTLGYRSRRAMYEDLTAEELIEWEIAYKVDPWGEERRETLHGVLCNLMDACHRTKGSPEPPLHYMPFMKAISDQGEGQSVEEMKAIWKSLEASW